MMTAPCPRCGEPTKSVGKSGVCRTCTATLARKKLGVNVLWEEQARKRAIPAMKEATRRRSPITLPKAWGDAP